MRRAVVPENEAKNRQGEDERQEKTRQQPRMLAMILQRPLQFGDRGSPASRALLDYFTAARALQSARGRPEISGGADARPGTPPAPPATAAGWEAPASETPRHRGRCTPAVS